MNLILCRAEYGFFVVGVIFLIIDVQHDDFNFSKHSLVHMVTTC